VRLKVRLNKPGIPPRAGQRRALMHLAQRVDPPVLASLLGFSPTTMALGSSTPAATSVAMWRIGPMRLRNPEQMNRHCQPWNPSVIPVSWTADATAHMKDAVENYLNREVCRGTVSLADAQRQLATDWLAVYRSHGLRPAPLTESINGEALQGAILSV
jgi:hypothetical protein